MAIVTIGMFGGTAAQYRQWWQSRFWLALFVLFVLHVVVWVTLWRRGVDWRGIQYVMLAMAETAAMVVALDWLGFRVGGRSGRKGHSPRSE